MAVPMYKAKVRADSSPSDLAHHALYKDPSATDTERIRWEKEGRGRKLLLGNPPRHLQPHSDSMQGGHTPVGSVSHQSSSKVLQMNIDHSWYWRKDGAQTLSKVDSDDDGKHSIHRSLYEWGGRR